MFTVYNFINPVMILKDLNVKGMIQNKRLARSAADAGWGISNPFMAHKAARNNTTVVFAGRFFPSSKRCCG